jgi:hypothetical protein
MINFEELTQNAIDGVESPFKAYKELKELKAKVDEALKQVEPIALEEAEKHEKTFEVEGMKFERRDGRRVFNFKNIKEWNTYDKAKKDCEARYKAAFSNFEKGLSAVTDDGEVLELPKVTYTKSSLIVKNNPKG